MAYSYRSHPKYEDLLSCWAMQYFNKSFVLLIFVDPNATEDEREELARILRTTLSKKKVSYNHDSMIEAPCIFIPFGNRQTMETYREFIETKAVRKTKVVFRQGGAIV